jgi:aryl-alcohol dehydrogenase-like predicted oxidoreductase
MKKRALGNNGTKVSAMGIGAMSFSNFYGATNDENSYKILETAMDLGVNHIDTANVYGMGVSEERIGSFLKSNGTSAKQYFKIATKGGISKDNNGNQFFDNSYDHLKKELDNSLDRLGVDQVELYYIHRLDKTRSLDEIVDTLVSFIKDGKINQFGFSEIAPTTLEKISAIHPVGAIQSEYSLSTRYPELGLLQKTQELNTSLVAFSPIGRSLLTDKPIDKSIIPSLPFLKQNPRFTNQNYEANIKACEGFRTLAKEYNLTAAGLAIAWLTNKDEHILTIPGTRSVDHFTEMTNGTNTILTREQMQEIEKVLPVGWAHGDRYSQVQWSGPEKYC